MTECICEFDEECDGSGNLQCRGCGGDGCFCAACFGHGESECYGCDMCEPADDGVCHYVEDENANGYEESDNDDR